MQKLVTRNDLPGISLTWEEPPDKEARVRMVMRSAVTEEGDVTASDGRPRALRTTNPKAPPAPKAAAPMPLLMHMELTDRTIARVRKAFPGWDIYALKAEFDDWLMDRPERQPNDYQAAFYGFVKAHHQRNHA